MKVREIISEQLGMEIEEVTTTATFSDLGADSLDVVEVAMVLEEELEIEIDEQAMEKMKNVEDLVRYIEDKFVTPR